jgi:hypothetical protein
LSGLLLAYSAFAVFAVIMDYFALAKYLLVRENIVPMLAHPGAEHVYVALSGLFSLGLLSVVLAAILVRDKTWARSLYWPSLDPSDWGVIIFFAGITLLRLPFPDASFDVLNYHLYLQEFKFENAVTYHFMPAGVAGFSLPLADRMFYVFRLLLGYRGGVILNTLVLILLYFQVKDLIKLAPNMGLLGKHQGLALSLSALFALSTEHIFANIGVYMVDLLLVPFLLELLRMAFAGRTLPQFALIYSGLMFGLGASVKLTSLVFSVLLLAIIVLRYRRELTVSTAIISSLAIVFPIVTYLTYNFIETHNPVFPYLNEIFRSPLFPPTPFISATFPLGPKTPLEFLGWPLYIIFEPQRTSELWYNSGRLGLGLLCAIAYTVLGFLWRKRDHISLGLLVLASMYLWILAKGLVRYGSFLEIVASILVVDLLCILRNWDVRSSGATVKGIRRMVTRYRNRREHFRIPSTMPGSVFKLALSAIAAKGLVLLLIMAMLASWLYTFYYSSLTNLADWSQRGPAYVVPQNYFKNVGLIGGDYLPFPSPGSRKILETVGRIDIWVNFEDRPIAGYLRLLRSDIPILTINQAGTFTSLLRGKRIYMLSIKGLSRPALALEAHQYGFKVLSVREIQPTFTFLSVQLCELALR